MSDSIQHLKKEIQELEQKIIHSFTILNKVDLKEFIGCSAVAEIGIEVCGKPAVLSVGFPDTFPSDLPKFYDKKNQFGDIPHKLYNGLLCFTRNESLIIDERYPASIVLNCLEKVINLLESGIKGENKEDFMLEFEVYWRLGALLEIFAYIDTDNTKLRELDLWHIKTKNDALLFVASEKNATIEKAANLLFHFNVNDAKKCRCIYFPLNDNTFLMPPTGEEKWDFSTLKENIFQNLSEEKKKEFQRIVSKPTKEVGFLEFVIIGLPLSNGNVALFGSGVSSNSFNFKSHKNKGKNKKKVHPLVLKPKDVSIYNAEINRWHPNFLLKRTGGNNELKDKHILIAGLGSVGSEIALRFAKAGVEKLTLVDFDDMEVENIHRHALGSDQVFVLGEKTALINKPKVLGIKEEINRKYPFTKVETIYDSIFSVLENKKMKKNEIDLIVVAIGSPNKEMRINRKLHQFTNPPPAIFTWVEPLGIGGHTLLTLNGEKKGCYQCLFKPEEDSPIYNRSAFAKPFQEFSKTITGCGSVFTPYNFLDSERSAILTVETAIKLLIGQIKGNPLLSWKGDDILFKERGFQTTKRYLFNSEQLESTKYLYIDKECKVCSIEGRDIHK